MKPSTPKPASLKIPARARPLSFDALLRRANPSLRHLIRGLRDLDRSPGGKRRADTAAQRLLWLKKALQTAVSLEFSTIPPYLCAIWTIRENRHPVANSLREVLQEEMLHMALACNLLVSIGGSPQIAGATPIYPGHLPGGVHEHLTVGLAPFNRATLLTFMEIERPKDQLSVDGADPAIQQLWQDHLQDTQEHRHPDVTIGEFYDAILETFQKLSPTLETDNQITGPLAWSVISDLAGVERAIHLIQRQGEGSTTNPTDSGRDDLSHYYRFMEMVLQRQLIWDNSAKVMRLGAPIPMPDTLPMAPIPAGGYDPATVTPEVGRLLRGFDETYTKLLQLLQGTWTRGGQGRFVNAIGTMFQLEATARPLMQIPLPDGSGLHYGPCFRDLTGSTLFIGA